MSESKNHAETIAELTRGQEAAPHLVALQDGRTFIARPTGIASFEIKDITEPHTRPAPIPQYVSRVVALDTASSLTDYANRFKNSHSAIGADIDDDLITLIVDYHHAADADGKVAAQTYDHKAQLKLSKSDEWTTWTQYDGKWFSHLAFANFLEENAEDVAEPTGTDLLELCRDLEGMRGYRVKSVAREGSVKNFEVVKDNNVATRSGVVVPDRFLLEIPVYFGEPAVSVRAMLRTEVDDDGVLKLGYKLLKLRKIQQEDFHRIVTDVMDNTGVFTIYGAL